MEHQFKPGVSGNPAGCPKGVTYFRWHVCRYLAMTDGELREAERAGGLTQVQRAALKAVKQIVKRGLAGKVWEALRELMHYDEGKPTEHVHIDREQELSEEECDQIRQEYARKFGVDAKDERDRR